MTMAITAVVFDWAGTTIDFGCRAPVVGLVQLFADAGVAIDEAAARRDMGRAKRDHIRAILAMPHVHDAWVAVHGGNPDEGAVDRLHDRVVAIMRAAARDCATLIPGTAELVARLRASAIKIGSCTGYTRDMMADLLPLAAAQGYSPDCVVCSGETVAGRPSPLMLWRNLVDLGVWPAATVVKVDDATVGIAEGRAAGAWTVGVAASGNGVGLSHEALAALDPTERAARIGAAGDELRAAGADYVVDTIADLGPVLAAIDARLAAGERPAV